MFSIEDRNLIHDHVLQLAASDPRVVAGAVVGSLALDEGDRWSDLDLTFAVAEDFSIFDVLEDWTGNIVEEFDAAHLFDLPSGASIYRVFLLPGCLQFDLSFSPASKFGAAGPKFRLLFGSSVEKPYAQPPPAKELFGYAVHHALRARFCIERGRYWHAEYWISGARDYALGWLVAGAGCLHFMAEALMIFPLKCATLSSTRWSLRWSAMNCYAPSAASLMDYWVNQMRLKSWLQKSNHT